MSQLSERLYGTPRTCVARFFEALFAQGSLQANVRSQLYGQCVRLDDGIKDPAQRVDDAQPMVRFLESRLAAESDTRLKSEVEQALARLRKAIEEAQKK